MTRPPTPVSTVTHGFPEGRRRRKVMTSTPPEPVRGESAGAEGSNLASLEVPACSLYEASASGASLINEAIYIGTEHAWKALLATLAQCHLNIADHAAVNRMASTYMRRMPHYLTCAERSLRAELRDNDRIDDAVQWFVLRVAIEFRRDDSAIWSACKLRDGSLGEKYMLGFAGDEFSRRLRQKPNRLHGPAGAADQAGRLAHRGASVPAHVC